MLTSVNARSQLYLHTLTMREANLSTVLAYHVYFRHVRYVDCVDKGSKMPGLSVTFVGQYFVFGRTMEADFYVVAYPLKLISSIIQYDYLLSKD